MKLDLIELHPLGPLQIREINEDGTYHRRVIEPVQPDGEAVDVSGEDAKIKAAAKKHWTATRVNKFRESQKAAIEE